MGASNRIQDLDPALLRPGRFDRQILVSPPDLAGREAILRVHTRGKPLAADVDLEQIARQTAGLTGADLANIANEAAIFAGRHERAVHRARRLRRRDRARRRRLCSRRRCITEKEKRILAYHEAGHALMSHLDGRRRAGAEGDDRRPRPGARLHAEPPEEDRYLQTKEELVDWMKICLAGRAAEQVVFGRVTNGAANDLEKVTHDRALDGLRVGHVRQRLVAHAARRQLRALGGDEAAARPASRRVLTDGAYTEAMRLLEKHRASLDRLATALLEKETLVREELVAMLGDVEPESRASEPSACTRVSLRGE